MKPLVGILMGSDSDLAVMMEVAETLEAFAIPYELEITSAHRSPEATRRYARAAADRGLRVLIVGAGGAAHLAGVVAAETVLPVIGVPLASSSLLGLDALLSTVQMPAGVPVATMAIGKAGAANAAVLAAQILALSDESIHARLSEHKRHLAEKVAAKSQEVQQRLQARSKPTQP